MSDDDRGRVPFALVGVLLLVASAAIAATSQPRGAPAEPAVSKALDSATAQVQTDLRDAATTASRDAARNPVVQRANTTYGRVINESSPFRDSLRVRIYLAARERLQRIDRRRGDVRVTASLPPVNDASDLRAAKRRVHVERADANGTTMRVHVENVSVTARRNGDVVTERSTSPSMVVSSPALALHDRVSAYQQQLDAGVTEPGLDQRLTAQLYALTWARGYGQFAGAPIDNVVTNRHVALATNVGLLDVQRETIGTSDAGGRRALARATAKTAGKDLLAASGRSPPPQVSFDAATKPAPNEISGLDPPDGTRRDDEMTVGVNGTADEVFLSMLGDGRLNRSISTVYSADARYVTRVDRVSGGRPGVPSRPGAGWRLVGEHRTSDPDVSAEDVEPPSTPSGWHRFESYGRSVEVTWNRSRTWQRGNETKTTHRSSTERMRVSVAVVGRHATSQAAPKRGIRTAHQRGEGPFEGPNLADVRNRTIERLVTRRGGSEAIVERAATGRLDDGVVRIEASQPTGIYRWSYRDLMQVREEVRSISVSVERGKVGTFEVHPQAKLAERLRDRREALVDAPATYDDTATKARVAARAAYVDAVVARLEERAGDRRERAGDFGDALKDRGAGSLANVRKSAGATRSGSPERQPTLQGPAGPVRLRVDSAPSYLTVSEVDAERVPAMDGAGHPLVVRNINVFTIPYGDASDTVVDGLIGSGGKVRLATAARTLRAANETLERRNVTRVRERRDVLSERVAFANLHVRSEMQAELKEFGVGDGSRERFNIVASGLVRWGTRASRGIAIANGSASEAVVAEAAARTSMNATRRDRLELELEERTQTALQDGEARVEMETVNGSRTATRKVATETTKKIAKNASKQGVERLANRSFDRIPAGLPLTPLYGWYVTTNVWHVTVRGEYARFGVRADRGRPTTPGGDVTYVRDGDTVTLDVDDDGTTETLGNATRVNFDVSTTIVIVVPPGKSGVGDRDGNTDERSDGWPEPGTS